MTVRYGKTGISYYGGPSKYVSPKITFLEATEEIRKDYIERRCLYPSESY